MKIKIEPGEYRFTGVYTTSHTGEQSLVITTNTGSVKATNTTSSPMVVRFYKDEKLLYDFGSIYPGGSAFLDCFNGYMIPSIIEGEKKRTKTTLKIGFKNK